MFILQPTGVKSRVSLYGEIGVKRKFVYTKTLLAYTTKTKIPINDELYKFIYSNRGYRGIESPIKLNLQN